MLRRQLRGCTDRCSRRVRMNRVWEASIRWSRRVRSNRVWEASVHLEVAYKYQVLQTDHRSNCLISILSSSSLYHHIIIISSYHLPIMWSCSGSAWTVNWYLHGRRKWGRGQINGHLNGYITTDISTDKSVDDAVTSPASRVLTLVLLLHL